MTTGRERLNAFTPAEIRDAAETLARYRITSLAVLRQADRGSRIANDVCTRFTRRGSARLPEDSASSSNPRPFSPQQMRNRPNAKDPSNGEVAIPARLAKFAVDFRGLSGLLEPNQDMANVISLELARGWGKVPPYTPFIVPEISGAPWPVASSDHSAAIGKWWSNTRIAKREIFPHDVPIQAWSLYQLRFLLTAEMMGALGFFGGLPAGLDHLAIVSNMATTDSAAVAMVYGRLAKQHLEEKARARAETTLAGGYFSSFLATENAAFRLQSAKKRAPRPHPVKNTQATGKNATADSAALPSRQYVRRCRTLPKAASPPRRRSPAVRGRSLKRSRIPPRNPPKKRETDSPTKQMRR